MGQFMGLFEEPKRKRKTDAISKSILFKSLYDKLIKRGYDEDESWEKAYAITKKQIIRKQNLNKKKMMKKPTNERNKFIGLVDKYMEMGKTRELAKVAARKELTEMMKRKIAEERDEDFLQFKKKAVQKNKIVELDPRIGKFMNEFIENNEGAPESEGLEYARNKVRMIVNKESDVKKKNLKAKKEKLLKAQKAQQKVLKEAEEAKKKAKRAKREAEKKAREGAKK